MRALPGFIILLLVFVIALILTENAGLSLVAVCAALILLPPMLDPAIQSKEARVDFHHSTAWLD